MYIIKVFSLKNLSQFPITIWTIQIGTFITRGAFYMVWPFVAVVLYRKFGMSASQVGMILGLSALVSAVAGLYVGSLSDRFGRNLIIQLGCVFSIVSYMVLAFADQPQTFISAVLACSVSRSVLEPPIKAMIGDLLTEKNSRELALQINYFMINLGSSIGPLIGFLAGIAAQQATFGITSLSFFLFALALFYSFQIDRKIIQNSQSSNSSNFLEIISVLKKDHAFLAMIVANILVIFVWVNWESTLIQFLIRADIPDTVQLISMIIITLSVTVAVCQIPLQILLEGLDIKVKLGAGIMLLASAQIWYATNPVEFFAGWLGATFVLGLAEAILFPLMSIQIDRMAPNHLRGSYFGAASFFFLGPAFAPIFGGFMLDYAGREVLYGTLLLICFVVVFFQFISLKIRNNNVL